MRFWGRAIGGWTARVFVALLALACLLAASRLMPWIVDPRVGWRVVGSFARALVTGAIEVSVCVALPLGFCLAAASLVDSGEAQVALLSGRSPLRVGLAGWPVVVALGGLSIATSLAWGVRASDTAALGELVAAARQGCEGRALSEVPSTGVAWTCLPVPRLTGVFGDALAVDATALSSSASGDVVLSDLRASLRGPPALTLSVATANVRGLSPHAPPSGAVGGVRALVEIGAASVGALVGFSLIVRRGWGHRAVALSLGAAVAALSLSLGALIR